jgi:predicted nucleotidyltransferase
MATNGLTDNELAAIRKLKDILVRDYGLVEMKLIGSKARGDSDPESDIDLVIVVRELDRRVRLGIFGLCSDIGLEHDTVLSPIVYSLQEFDGPLTRVTPFYRNVEREGVLL